MPALIAACRAGFLTLAGGENLAHDDLIHIRRIDLGPLQRALDGDGASSWAGRLDRAPENAPTGVRAALTMTISFEAICSLPEFWTLSVAELSR